MDVLNIKIINDNYINELYLLLSNEDNGYGQFFYPFDFSKGKIEEIINNIKNDLFFGFFLKGELIGFFMLRGFDEGFETPSYGVYISKDYSNRGLAKLSLFYVISFCKINDIKKLMLKVHPKNIVAKNLYEKIGFVFKAIDNNNSNLIYELELT